MDLQNPDMRASMLSFDQFDELFREALAEIPEHFREGVSQFIIEESIHNYSSYMRGLYVLGHYMPRGHFGNPVVILYFGSFLKAFPHYLIADFRREITKTLTHELLHHWENRSGIDNLGEEDRRQLLEWKINTGYVPGSVSTGKNYIEAAFFVYLVFIFVGLLARWMGLR